MRITDLLSKESIRLDGVSSTKKETIRAMADLMEKSGKISDKNAYIEGLIKREEESTTAVGEGIEEATKAGILGGFPVLGVCADVFDGSYHEVDSSEMAFHIAGSMAFKDAMAKAGAVLLEPIMKVEVTMPEEYMGDVIGDINSRRGRIEGFEDIGGGKLVKAFVPLAEMFGYSTDLRSRTQGRGNYSMFFEKYEQVPKSVQEKIIAERKGAK